MDEDEFNSVSLLSLVSFFFVPFLFPFFSRTAFSTSIKYKRNFNWMLHFKRYSIKINIKLQFLFEFVEFTIDSQSYVYEPLECNWTGTSKRSFGHSKLTYVENSKVQYLAEGHWIDLSSMRRCRTVNICENKTKSKCSFQ